MKLAYIYQEGTNIKKANIYQSYSMVKSFGKHIEVVWYRGSKTMLSRDDGGNIKERKVLNFGFNRIESISRLVFCLHSFLLLTFDRPDVIFTRDFAFLFFYSKLPKWLRFKSRIVFESHKMYNKVSKKVNLEQESSSYSIVDQFVCVSEGIKQDLIADFEVEEKAILIAPNGIEIWNKSKSLSSNISDQQVNFIYAGSYGEWKGVDTILEASLLLEEFPCHIYLVGIDENVPNYNNDFVTIMAPMERNELYSFYEKMDVGILPTLNHLEGTRYTSPIKFYEYAYAGLDILASDIPSIREIEKQGFMINFFEVGNASALANKMQSIVSVGVNKKHIINNKNLVLNYTWHKRAAKIINFINQAS